MSERRAEATDHDTPSCRGRVSVRYPEGWVCDHCGELREHRVAEVEAEVPRLDDLDHLVGVVRAAVVRGVLDLGHMKYISRAGKKSSESSLDDLKKARWYLEREIARLERG